MKTFKASDRNQPFLLPPSIQEWLPEKHLARYIVNIVEPLNLSKIIDQYTSNGKEAYSPSVMLSFYGNLLPIWRKIGLESLYVVVSG